MVYLYYTSMDALKAAKAARKELKGSALVECTIDGSICNNFVDEINDLIYNDSGSEDDESEGI